MEGGARVRLRRRVRLRLRVRVGRSVRVVPGWYK